MAVIDTLREKAKEHNEEVGNDPSKRTSARTLKICYDRGLAAYRTNPQSVRPSVTSASQWAYARCNSLLYALRNGKFRSGKHDTDLLPKGHPLSSKKQAEMTEQGTKAQLSYFRTQEEAEEYAEFLGCRGTHTHEMDGDTYHMACSSHERNIELEEMRQGKKQVIGYKGMAPVIKDLDRKNGVVTGYFAQFGEVDSDMDMIAKGAFAKSLMENGSDSSKPRIMHLYQHDVQKPLAKPHVLREDDYGLYFESKIVGTSYGEDVLKLYEAGVINEHSIGFQTVKSQPREGYSEIQEVKLFEGSTVTFGANENTPFMGFKDMSPVDAVERLDVLTSAVRKGTFTDETFHLLELQLKQVQQFIIDHMSQQKAEPSQDTHAEMLPADIDEAFDKLTIKLLDPKKLWN